MKKCFTKAERKELEEKLEKLDSAFDGLIEFMREKHDRADEWMSERSEQWEMSENGEAFNDWANELDFKIDEIQMTKDEISLEAMDEIL